MSTVEGRRSDCGVRVGGGKLALGSECRRESRYGYALVGASRGRCWEIIVNGPPYCHPTSVPRSGVFLSHAKHCRLVLLQQQMCRLETRLG